MRRNVRGVDTLADLRRQHRVAIVRSYLTDDLVERAALQASAHRLYDQIYGSMQVGPDDVLEDLDDVAGDGLEDIDDEPEDTFSGAAIVLIVQGDEQHTYDDGDSAPLHCTIVFLGDLDRMSDEERAEVIETARHIGQTTAPFTAQPVSAAQFGDEEVKIIESPDLVDVRNLATAPAGIGARAASVEHPLWLPHVSGLDDRPEVRFDRVGAWLGDSKYNFELGGMSDPSPE